MTKPSTKKTSARMTQDEQKAEDAKFLLELQKAQANDVSEAIPVAVKLFGADVDPLISIALSDRMFDDNGELDEKQFATKMNEARSIAVALFGDKGNRPDVVIAIYDKVIDVDMGDEDEE